MRRLPLLAPIALAACVDVGPDTSVTSEEIISPLREPQGRSYFGVNLDTRTTGALKYSVSSDVVWQTVSHPLVVHGACLALASSPTTCLDFDQMGVTPKMTTGGLNPEELRIVTGEPYVGPAPIPNTWRYKVRRILGPSTFENLCNGPTSTGYAFPIAGEWTTTGLHLNTAGRISWACEDEGVAAKAIQWGSPPGNDPTQFAWVEHEVAVRMGRADYCYNGQSHTVDGTEIGIYTNLTVPTDGGGHPLPIINGLVLEAAWPPALGSGGGGSAICFSKARWATMGFGDQCGGNLPDPRDPEKPTAKFCDDMTLPELVSEGAILFNTSAVNDLGIYRWVNGSDRWSTTQGFVNKNSSGGPGNIPPAPGFTFARREGNLLSDAGRAAFINNNQFVAADFIALNTYLVAGDHVLTTTNKVPAGGVFLNTEGFLWKTQPVGLPVEMVPVELVRLKKGNDYLTTTDVAGAIADGYTNAVSLGWGLVSH